MRINIFQFPSIYRNKTWKIYIDMWQLSSKYERNQYIIFLMHTKYYQILEFSTFHLTLFGKLARIYSYFKKIRSSQYLTSLLAKL